MRRDRELLPFQVVIGVTAGAIGGIIAVLGELRDDFGFSDTDIGVIVMVGFMAAFVAQAGLARLADRGFARQMATAGIALSGAGLMMMVFVDGLGGWSLSRALLGFGGGLTIPGLRRAASVLDPARVGENLGRLIVGEVVGFIAGPIVSALLVQVGGIRAPFLVFGVGMVVFLPFVMRLPPDRGQIDRSGRATAFDLLRVRRLQGALLIVGGYFVLIGAWEAVMPVMFQDRGGSSLHTGVAFTLLAIPIALVGPFAGRTADRIGPPRVALAGTLLVAGSTMFYGVLPGILLPTLLMFVFGIADGFGFTAAQVAVSRAVPEDRQAAALGLMGAVEVLGAGLAALPAAVVYDRFGDGPTWFLIGLTTLAIVGVGGLRIRGTTPHRPVPLIAEI